jgi:hypothetical protein
VSAKALASLKLPAPFADLQPWEGWIQPDEQDRVQRHVTVPTGYLGDFYRAVLPRIADIYDYLAEIPLGGEFKDEDLALLLLAVAFAEVADGVEFYAPSANAPDCIPRMIPMHDSVLGWRN